MIQNLLEYYSFSKDRVFEHLGSLFSRKLHSQATYCRALTEIAEEAEYKAKTIQQYGLGRPHSRQWLSAYVHVYLSLKQELDNEVRQIEQSQENHEQAYIQAIQSCKLSHIDSQKHFIEYTQKQLSEAASKIGQKVCEIEKKQAEIDGIKLASFSRMLEFLNEFDEEMIREKYLQEQSEKNFKHFGSRRREMNEKLDEVSALDQEIKAKLREIRQIEKERGEVCNKVCDKLNQIENAKLETLYKICSTFENQFKPICAHLEYKDLIESRGLEIPFTPSRYFLQNYKKSLYLLLNPHPQNKLLIEHRESLATELSLSLREERKGEVFEALSVEQMEVGKQEGYNGYVEFVYRIRSTIASAYHSEEELTAFYEFFQTSVRKKPLREVFLFYLYELGRMESELMGLVCKEGKALVHMLDIFLSQCLTFYDSQSAIKALMLLYHVKLPESPQLHLVVRNHAIWKSFQFWETSFLESVYEYFEVVVIYYHKLVESQSEKAPSRSNWFTSIFNIFPKGSEKKKAPQDSLKDFYHEILQNLTIIYLANMVMMRVPHAIVERFKHYVAVSVGRLNWPAEFSENLRSLMQVVCKKSEKNVKRLLTNDNVLTRVMSKLIGSSQQEKQESIPLSKSIADWLEDR